MHCLRQKHDLACCFGLDWKILLANGNGTGETLAQLAITSLSTCADYNAAAMKLWLAVP